MLNNLVCNLPGAGLPCRGGCVTLPRGMGGGGWEGVGVSPCVPSAWGWAGLHCSPGDRARGHLGWFLRVVQCSALEAGTGLCPALLW